MERILNHVKAQSAVMFSTRIFQCMEAVHKLIQRALEPANRMILTSIVRTSSGEANCVVVGPHFSLAAEPPLAVSASLRQSSINYPILFSAAVCLQDIFVLSIASPPP